MQAYRVGKGARPGRPRNPDPPETLVHLRKERFDIYAGVGLCPDVSSITTEGGV